VDLERSEGYAARYFTGSSWMHAPSPAPTARPLPKGPKGEVF